MRYNTKNTNTVQSPLTARFLAFSSSQALCCSRAFSKPPGASPIPSLSVRTACPRCRRPQPWAVKGNKVVKKDDILGELTPCGSTSPIKYNRHSKLAKCNPTWRLPSELAWALTADRSLGGHTTSLADLGINGNVLCMTRRINTKKSSLQNKQ